MAFVHARSDTEPFHSKAPDEQQSKAFNLDILVFFCDAGSGGITSQ